MCVNGLSAWLRITVVLQYSLHDTFTCEHTLRTGLHEQDRDIWIFRQSAGEYTSRRAYSVLKSVLRLSIVVV
jgi:hypothetical protein